MAWIESHQEVGQHPKTRRLAKALGVGLPTAVGHLHYLWWWCLSFSSDGNLARFEETEIAEAALWDGPPDKFIAAMVKAGWLDVDPLRVHDWVIYAHRMMELKLKRSVASQSGYYGNHIRWHVDRHIDDSDCTYCQQAKVEKR